MMQGLFIEMRSAVKDFRGAASTDWRRMGFRALPVAAAAVAGAGGLCVKKQLDPPSKDFLGQRSSFQCQRVEPAGAASLERRLEAAGADLAALRRAARRMRGPVERDLAALATDEQILGRLLEEWRTAGYLSEPLDRPKPRLALQGIDPVTQIDESYGRDVGSEVPLCLLRDGRGESEAAEFRTLAPEDWAPAAGALDAHGAVMLRGLLPPSQVQALRASLGVQGSALDRARGSSAEAEAMAPVREYDCAALLQRDPDLEPVVSTPGRRHFCLRGRVLEEVVSGIQAGAMPLVWEHLVRGGGDGRRPYVSEVQLIISDPCAADQFWHIDNSAPGVTLFVPLTPVPQELGPTLFMPGSHHLFTEDGILRRLRRFASSFLDSEGAAVGTMGPGDALIYDSRVIHRGAANRRYDRTRVALIFRYDFERPPGLGSVGTQLLSWLGNTLAVFQRCYAALPSGPTPAAPAPAAAAAAGGSRVGTGA